MVSPKINLRNLDKSDWQTYRFDEIAQKFSERVDPNNTDLTTYIGLEHIDSESLHIRRVGTPDDVNGAKLKFHKGDIIFGRRRAYQRKAGIATMDGFCSAHALVLRANPEVINPDLFPFFIHSDSFMDRAVDISVGSLSPTINWGTLKHQEFRLPPKKMQVKLAELLWNSENYRQKSIAIFTKLADARRSYFRESISAAEYVPLEELCAVFYGLGQPPEKDANGVPVVRATDIKRGEIDESNFLRIKPSEISKKKNAILRSGDIIVVRSGAYTGDLALIPEHLEGAVAGYDLIARHIDGKIIPKFLVEYLLDDPAQRYFKGESIRSAQPHLNSKQLLNTMVPVLKLTTQEGISQQLEKFDVLRISLRDKVKTSTVLHKIILESLF